MNEKLSICIPTYNRSDYLIECLNSFLPQLKKHNIAVYISDNASTDNTLKKIKKFKKEKYQNIYVRSNEYNLGIDQNILKVVEMAQSEYVWLFSDDDFIEEKCIDRILEEIQKKYGLIIINSSTYSYDFSEKIESKHLNITDDKIYYTNDHNEFLEEIGPYTTFLGSLIIEKELWNTVDLSKYKSNDFIHCWIIFNFIVNNKVKILVISEPYIRIRLGNASWSNRFFEVWYINWPDLIWNLSKKYLFSAKEKVSIKDLDNLSLKKYLILRMKNIFNSNIYYNYLEPKTSMSFFKKNILFFISILPQRPLRNILKVYLLIKKPTNYKFQLYSLNHMEEKK